VYVTLEGVQTQKLTIAHLARPLLIVFAIGFASVSAEAQTYSVAKARRHFVTFSYDFLYSQPLHFDDHPLEDLVGQDVAGAQFEQHDYQTRDGAILIDVLEFRRRSRGFGVTLYPFGMSVGPTLALRGSIENMPVARIAFEGAGAPADYAFTGGKAYDLALGIYVSDRSPGWGLGSHAFVAGGLGRIRGNERDGDRYFAEGGGGLTAGPIGVELSVKFAWNNFTEPVKHKFLTVPVTVRGTVTF
jgi:hypothetical protein